MGAHFVLCNPNTPKKPAYKHWLKQPPHSAKSINWIRQGGALGLIPASIDSAVLDVDSGNPESLARDFKPYAQYESRTRGHRHLWYESRQPVQLYLWEFGDCSGQVISSNRHISLPTPEHVSVIYQGMVTNSDCVFPDISFLSPISDSLLVTSDSDRLLVTSDSHSYTLTDTGIQDAQDATTLIGKVHTLKVDRASIGERNISLFDDLRRWAYQQPRGRDYRVWEWTVSEYALELREHLGNLWDFGIPETLATGKSVALWTWENGGAGVSHSHDSEGQRKRAYLRAKRARQRAHNRDAEIVVWRDAHGESWREIAALMGMSQAGVRKAYARKTAELGE